MFDTSLSKYYAHSNMFFLREVHPFAFNMLVFFKKVWQNVRFTKHKIRLKPKIQAQTYYVPQYHMFEFALLLIRRLTRF